MPDHDDEVAPILAMSAATPIVAIHPLVRIIPETGEKALFVSPSTISRIVGLSTVESRTLLDLFCQEITRDEYRVRFRWQPGSVAFWDNRTTAHLAALDHDHLDQARRLYRVTLLGDTPVGPDGTASTTVAGAALTAPPESARQPAAGTTSRADRT
jgi:taurine dioxygenase